MARTFSSRTAIGTAMRRAAHQLFDRPLVLVDPLAYGILEPELQQRVANGRADHDAPRSRHLRALLVARSRYAEDNLAVAVGRGTRQYVVLGAGLDTSALRSTEPALRVFEVDHPGTQSAKRAAIARAGIAVPPTVEFVPVDFEKESLDAALARAGFDREAPTFFSWLGVTPYLTRDAIVATLHFIAGLRSGAEIVFDFALPSAASSPLAVKLAALGEPFRSFFDPGELTTLVRSLGFDRADVLDHAMLNQRYFDERSDGLRLEGSGQLLHARRDPSRSGGHEAGPRRAHADGD